MAKHANATTIEKFTNFVPADRARLVLELVWLLLVVWNILVEVVEIMGEVKESGLLMGFGSYVSQVWNLIDWLNIALQLQLTWTWWTFATRYAATFKPRERYNALAALDAKSDFFRLGAGYGDVATMFDNVHAMSALMSSYMMLNVASVILMTLRVIKLLDFQPRLGLVTRTLAKASVDLAHFMLVWGFVHSAYAMMGYISFGSSIEELSTFPRAASTLMMVRTAKPAAACCALELTCRRC